MFSGEFFFMKNYLPKVYLREISAQSEVELPEQYDSALWTHKIWPVAGAYDRTRIQNDPRELCGQ